MPWFQENGQYSDVSLNDAPDYEQAHPKAQVVSRLADDTGHTYGVPYGQEGYYAAQNPKLKVIPSISDAGPAPTVGESLWNIPRAFVQGAAGAIGNQLRGASTWAPSIPGTTAWSVDQIAGKGVYANALGGIAGAIQSGANYIAAPEKLAQQQQLSAMNPARILSEAAGSTPPMLNAMGAEAAGGVVGGAIGTLAGPAGTAAGTTAGSLAGGIAAWANDADGEFQQSAKEVNLSDDIASKYGNEYGAITGPLMMAQQALTLGIPGAKNLEKTALQNLSRNKQLLASMGIGAGTMATIAGAQTAIHNYFLEQAGKEYQKTNPNYSLSYIKTKQENPLLAGAKAIPVGALFGAAGHFMTPPIAQSPTGADAVNAMGGVNEQQGQEFDLNNMAAGTAPTSEAVPQQQPSAPPPIPNAMAAPREPVTQDDLQLRGSAMNRSPNADAIAVMQDPNASQDQKDIAHAQLMHDVEGQRLDRQLQDMQGMGMPQPQAPQTSPVDNGIVGQGGIASARRDRQPPVSAQTQKANAQGIIDYPSITQTQAEPPVSTRLTMPYNQLAGEAEKRNIPVAKTDSAFTLQDKINAFDKQQQAQAEVGTVGDSTVRRNAATAHAVDEINSKGVQADPVEVKAIAAEAAKAYEVKPSDVQAKVLEHPTIKPLQEQANAIPEQSAGEEVPRTRAAGETAQGNIGQVDEGNQELQKAPEARQEVKSVNPVSQQKPGDTTFNPEDMQLEANKASISYDSVLRGAKVPDGVRESMAARLGMPDHAEGTVSGRQLDDELKQYGLTRNSFANAKETIANETTGGETTAVKIRGILKGTPFEKLVDVYPNMGKIPGSQGRNLRDFIMKQGGYVNGFYRSGRAGIIAKRYEKLSDAELRKQIMETARHELVGHFGADLIWQGKDSTRNQAMADLDADMQKKPKAMRDAWNADLKEMAEIYGLDLKTEKGKSEAVQEAIARMIQKDRPWTQHVIDWFKSLLEKLGFHDFEDKELRHMLSRITQSAKKGLAEKRQQLWPGMSNRPAQMQVEKAGNKAAMNELAINKKAPKAPSPYGEEDPRVASALAENLRKAATTPEGNKPEPPKAPARPMSAQQMRSSDEISKQDNEFKAKTAPIEAEKAQALKAGKWDEVTRLNEELKAKAEEFNKITGQTIWQYSRKAINDRLLRSLKQIEMLRASLTASREKQERAKGIDDSRQSFKDQINNFKDQFKGDG